MTGRDAFIQLVQKEIFDHPDVYAEGDVMLYEEAAAYFEALKSAPTKETKIITETGAVILKYLQEMSGTTSVFTAKSIGEGTALGSRKVSGSMRKLVSDGFVDKIGANPVSYKITTKGMEFTDFDIQ